jgi:predicted ArsR family transcriptional regulator
VSDELSAQAAGIGTLAEPVRRDLYRYVVAQAGPVSREQAAAGLGVALHTVKFHLDKLVEAGLLDVEYRRLTGRTGPGAGRPAKLYKRAPGELTVSVPQRRYDLAGQILARAVDRAADGSVPLPEAVRTAAHEAGTRAGHDAEDLTEALVEQGYEPRREDAQVVLTNCPFDALAREHTELVCGLNEEFVGGLLEGAGCAEWRACLEPEEGLCCVRLRPAGEVRD